jgi:hypothetical protein
MPDASLNDAAPLPPEQPPAATLARRIWADPRLRWAMLIAVASDLAGLFTEPVAPLQWAVDVLTALALLALLGWKRSSWRLAPTLIAEAIPGLGLMPFWVLVILWIASGRPTPRAANQPSRD